PYRIDLVTITVDDARALQGKRVRVNFVTGCPSYSINGLTAIGPGDQEHEGGEVSRGVVLKGDRVTDPGGRGTGVGQLLVIDHALRIVNGIPVPGWVEVRVEQE